MTTSFAKTYENGLFKAGPLDDGHGYGLEIRTDAELLVARLTERDTLELRDAIDAWLRHKSESRASTEPT